MHYSGITGPRLEGANILRFVHMNRNDEVPKDIAAPSSHRVWLGQFHNQVRRSHLPVSCEVRRGWQIGWGTFWCTQLSPIGDQAQLRIRKAAVSGDGSVT